MNQRHLLATLWLCMISTYVISQNGDFITTSHKHPYSEFDHITFDISKDNSGLIHIANRNGVMDYDGNTWAFYKTPTAALSLLIDSSNTVFVSCINSIGYLSKASTKNNYRAVNFSKIICSTSSGVLPE